MHFIKLSPTQLVQFNNDLEIACDHTFFPSTLKSNGEELEPTIYRIEHTDKNKDTWEFRGESALNMYEYMFNYQAEVKNVMSVEELRLDSKLTRKLEQQNIVTQINMDLLDEDIKLRKLEMEVKKQELEFRQADMEHSMLKIKLEREAILSSQARNLMPPRNLVS